MSQYPSPYNPTPFPPNYGYYAPMGEDLLAPARRAGILLIVLGVLGVLFGFCAGAMLMIVPLDQAMSQGGLPPEMLNGASPELFKVVAAIFSGVVALGGILIGISGFFVMRGRRGAVIAGLVLAVLAGLVMLTQVIAPLRMIVVHPDPAMLMGFCCVASPTLGFTLAILWLVQALRAAGRLELAQQQYQMQLWQMQQQTWQQAGGYGYALPNAPQAPPASSPPSAPNASPQEPPPSQS